MTTAMDRGWGNPASHSFATHITTIHAGGVSVNVNVKVAKLFTLLINELAKHYNIKGYKDDWGYANRPIRGYEKEYERNHDPKYLSNHAWGLAVDIDATVNPMTRDPHAHHEIIAAVVDPILARYRGRMVWGGEYHSERKDYMHFEFVGTPRDADVLTRQMGL